MEAKQTLDLKYVAGTRTPFGNFSTLEFELSVKSETKADTGKHILIALDKSGSMHYAMEDAKKSVISMIEYLHQNNYSNITFIPYNHEAIITEMRGQKFNEIEATINRIHADGGTEFWKAFQAIRKSIESYNSKNVCIVFFTDGQDGNRTRGLQELQNLKQFLLENTDSSETHTIGFTASHDAKLLGDITLMGKNQGTFQYCKSREEIDTCVSSISGLIGAAPLKGNLHLNDATIPLEINESENEFGKCFSCTATFDDELMTKVSKLKLTVTCGEDYALLMVDTDSLSEKQPSDYDRSHANAQRVKTTIMKIISTVSQMVQKNDSNKVALSNYLAEVNQNDQALDEIMKSIGKFKTSQRRTIFEFVQEVKDVIKEAYSLLSKLHSGHLDNNLIASLNSLAYRDITKKGLLKKLDQRAANNVDVINAIYPKIQSISTSSAITLFLQNSTNFSLSVHTS